MIFCCTPCSLPGLCDLLLYTVFPAWPGLLLLKSSRVTCPIPNLSFVFSPVTLCYTSRSSPFLCVFTCKLLLHIPFPTFPVPAAFTRVTHPGPRLSFVLSPVTLCYKPRSPSFLYAFTCNLVFTNPVPHLSFMLSLVTCVYKPRSSPFFFHL